MKNLVWFALTIVFGTWSGYGQTLGRSKTEIYYNEKDNW